MSISVGLINRRNSQPNKINFTRLKLSKNIDSNHKVRNKFKNLCFILKNFLSEALSFATALVGLFYAHYSATKFFLVVKFWWS